MSTFRRLIDFFTEERSLTILLVLMIVDLFVLVPTTHGGEIINLIGALVFALILLAGLVTMSRHRMVQMVFALFVFLAVVAHCARIIFHLPGLAGWDFLFSIFSVVGMLIVILSVVYRSGPVTSHRIRGAIAGYLLLATLFAMAYALISELSPGAFIMHETQSPTERMEAFYYFSVVTLTTVGFGDITAVHPMGRSLVMLEALIGQLYPAILIARLVSLQIETQRSGKGD